MRMTALVCTRDRGVAIAAAVQSILENDHPDFEVIVIDQSTSNESEAALSAFRGDPRLKYARSATAGLSRARNIGFSKATSSIVAMTDDDCIVPRSWLSLLETAFEKNNRIAMVLGSVIPAEHDKHAGFIVGYSPATSITADGIRDKHLVEGMGACMAMRKDAWLALAGFDELLGAGSLFLAADETDMVIRSLLAGYQVYETPDISVIHDGLHPWSQADAMARHYLLGIGAAMAKHVKCRQVGIAYVFAALAKRWLFEEPVVQYGFRPPRGVRLDGFLRGFGAAMTMRVDRRTGLFDQSKSSRPSAAPVVYPRFSGATTSKSDRTPAKDFPGIGT